MYLKRELLDMKKVAINTLGCKANQLESSIIGDDFLKNGYELVKFDQVADIYVINTCTVTAKSDSTSRYHIRQAKRTNPNAKIVVTGCYAQIAAEEVSLLQDVDLVVGNTEKQNIVEYITNSGILDTQGCKVLVSDIMQENSFKDKKVHSSLGRTRANIKIQDGCNFRCSYCIIPYARGKSRSNKLENVIDQINQIVEDGFKEIILSGIHLGQWGLDFSPAKTLVDLIRAIEKIDKLERFRISSIDPLEFDDNLINALVESKKFCKHLHISLQSADNEILSAMRRRYTVEYYSELINKLHEKIPGISIGSDIIVGFPGESDNHFKNTYENLKKLPITYIHVFTYSKRKGTPAAVMPEQVPENIKKERNSLLTSLAKQKNIEFRKSFLGQKLKVLIEIVRDKKTGLLKGISDNYIHILIDASDDFKNKILDVEIVEVNEESTFGKIV